MGAFIPAPLVLPTKPREEDPLINTEDCHLNSWLDVLPRGLMDLPQSEGEN